ncbi:MAG: efflux RND transporter periplasmic adaptor subunit [Sphingomonadaceae bacterium]
MALRRKWLAPGLLIGAVLALLVWQLFLREPESPQFVTAPVVRGDVEKTVVATGMLEPVEMVSVGAQASGRVEKLHVALGDRVEAGELIAEIDSQTQSNALATARAQLANAEAQRAGQAAALARAEAAFRRQQMMIAGEATSHADYEAAEAELKAARANVAALDAQIAQAKVTVSTASVNLGYTRIVSPLAGDVLSIVTTQGQTVNANQTTPTIVIVGDLSTMTVKAEVSEADVINVKPGMPVWFTVMGDADRRYEATLRQIEPAPESIVNEVGTSGSVGGGSSATSTAIYFNALFDVPNEDGRLRPMMTAQVTISLAGRPDVLTIPSAALGQKQRDGRYMVRVVDAKGDAQDRTIKIGLNTNVTAEVVDGLQEGEQVVIGEGAAAGQAAASSRPRMRGAGM